MTLAVLAAVALQGPSATDRATQWLRDAWSTVQREGRAAADRIVRESPAKFKQVRKAATDACDVCQKRIAEMDLESRRRVIVQLWQVRGSLNVLALANPNTLAVVGLDPDDVIALQKRVNTTWTSVAKRYPDVIKSLRLNR